MADSKWAALALDNAMFGTDQADKLMFGSDEIWSHYVAKVFFAFRTDNALGGACIDKYDEFGNLLWTKTYGDQFGYDSMVKIPNSDNYMIFGGYNKVIFIIDSDGVEQHRHSEPDRVYGGFVENDGSYYFGSVSYVYKKSPTHATIWVLESYSEAGGSYCSNVRKSPHSNYVVFTMSNETVALLNATTGEHADTEALGRSGSINTLEFSGGYAGSYGAGEFFIGTNDEYIYTYKIRDSFGGRLYLNDDDDISALGASNVRSLSHFPNDKILIGMQYSYNKPPLLKVTRGISSEWESYEYDFYGSIYGVGVEKYNKHNYAVGDHGIMKSDENGAEIWTSITTTDAYSGICLDHSKYGDHPEEWSL